MDPIEPADGSDFSPFGGSLEAECSLLFNDCQDNGTAGVSQSTVWTQDSSRGLVRVDTEGVGTTTWAQAPSGCPGFSGNRTIKAYNRVWFLFEVEGEVSFHLTGTLTGAEHAPLGFRFVDVTDRPTFDILESRYINVRTSISIDESGVLGPGEYYFNLTADASGNSTLSHDLVLVFE
ncbi:MAG: hypothetical protein KDA27_12740 [Candidatus Eisenbacteria bacterium]|uniref:Uncharacterized protein n=1 Tax=Eiseniibacteriota bacterium TaxID=2212470 RepID=A0A956NF33_UNCEI|nr:hypothetical protein [Candidatus Eisenbacteria bacterium]